MQETSLNRKLFQACLATALLFLVYFLLNHFLNSDPWKGMQISKSALTAEYCEWNNPDAFFHQRMNTYSNLSYFFLGILVILMAMDDRKNTKSSKQNILQQFPSLSLMFGYSLVYLCLGSSFFHASLTWAGQRVDMNGTYSITIMLSGISLYRLSGKNSSPTAKRWFLLILFALITLFVELHLLISSLYLLPAMMLLIITLSVLNYLNHKKAYRVSFAAWSFIFLIAAAALRTLDVSRLACDPYSWIQEHALWHLFTGLSAFMLYLFYRTERVV